MSNILITGASGGIGLATARLFAEKGHKLFLTYYKNNEALEALCEEFKGQVAMCQVDASVASEVKECVAAALSFLGSIDLLVNNAGMSLVGLDHELSSNDWMTILNTNLSSVTYFTREIVPSMLHQHSGRIINISSMWGSMGASCEAAYSATKGGINSYTKALGKELAPSHIPVNAIAFGAIDTKMNNHLSAEEKEALCEEIPFGRMASPEEAAEMIYLLFQAPDYLTGQVIGFDGGF